MPILSEKGLRMPSSPIRKLVPYAEDAKKRGIKIYYLNIGQPDIETPAVALDAIRHYPHRVVGYSHSAGDLSYRIKLCEYYKRHNIELTPEDIIVTVGASEALLFAMQSCMNEGDEIITTEPLYANYIGFAVNSGVSIKPITSTIENRFSLPEPEEFEKLITNKTKCILLCNPNNPTGYLYSKKELEVIRNLVLNYNLFLISDEVYREFVYDNNIVHSVMHQKGIEEHTILIDSVSKRYSACGFRIGNLVSRNKEFMKTAMKFAQARLSPPSFGQHAAEAAIDTPQSYFENLVDEYSKRRDTIAKSINSIKGAFCPNPKGAFYTVARLPIDDSDKFCQWLLEEFSYKKQTLMLAPATGFYSTKGKGLNEVRISYVLNVDDLQKSMECLSAALEQYPGKTV